MYLADMQEDSEGALVDPIAFQESKQGSEVMALKLEANRDLLNVSGDGAGSRSSQEK